MGSFSPQIYTITSAPCDLQHACRRNASNGVHHRVFSSESKVKGYRTEDSKAPSGSLRAAAETETRLQCACDGVLIAERGNRLGARE